jgi:hypothetical protein
MNVVGPVTKDDVFWVRCSTLGGRDGTEAPPEVASGLCAGLWMDIFGVAPDPTIEREEEA